MQPSQDQKQGHSDPKSYNLMNTVQHTQRTYTGNSREKLDLVLFVIWGIRNHVHLDLVVSPSSHLTKTFHWPKNESAAYFSFSCAVTILGSTYWVMDLNMFGWNLSHSDLSQGNQSLSRPAAWVYCFKRNHFLCFLNDSLKNKDDNIQYMQ